MIFGIQTYLKLAGLLGLVYLPIKPHKAFLITFILPF